MKAKTKLKLFIMIIFILLIAIILKYYRKINHEVVKNYIHFSKKKICFCTNETMHLKFDNYHDKHVPAVKKYKLINLENDKNSEINKGNLVAITNGIGYQIANLEYSSAHLHPKAKLILQELGQRFNEIMKNNKNQDSFFRVSSLLRTTAQQKSLSNHSLAATKQTSTHSYGLAFDISLLKSNECSLGLTTLQNLLNEMRAKGKILLCPEKGCIHVTVI